MTPAVRVKEKVRLHVLLVDDDRDTVLTLTALLHNVGYEVSAVYTGTQVLDAVARYKPDVCIIDIELPGQSGYAAATELNTQLQNESRPILIAISGKWTRPSEQLLASSVGFSKFFTKPAEPDELLQFLDEVATGLNPRP